MKRIYPQYRIAWTLKAWRFINGDVGKTYTSLEEAAKTATALNKSNRDFEYDAQTCNRRGTSVLLEAITSIPGYLVWFVFAVIFAAGLLRYYVPGALNSRDYLIGSVFMAAAVLGQFTYDMLKLSTGWMLELVLNAKARRGA
jgi:hypothetical protein